MTRGELKDIIKECLLEINSNNITIDDVVAESAILVGNSDFDSIYESYIEESNNFNRLVVDAINEKVSLETFKKLKEKAINLIKSIIEKIKKFISFFKSKIVALIGKIKTKILSLKKGKDLPALAKEAERKLISAKNESVDILQEATVNDLKEYLSSNLDNLDDDYNPYYYLGCIYDVGNKVSNMFKYNYNNSLYDKELLDSGNLEEYFIDNISRAGLKRKGNITGVKITEFIKISENQLDSIARIQDFIENKAKPGIKNLEGMYEELQDKLEEINKISNSEVANISSVDDLFSLLDFSSDRNKDDISDKLKLISKKISYASEFLSIVESVCTKWLSAYSQVRNKLISMCGLDIAKENED